MTSCLLFEKIRSMTEHTVQPPSPDQSPIPPAPSVLANRFRIPLIIAAVILLLLAGAGMYYAGRKTASPVVTKITPTVEPSPVPTTPMSSPTEEQPQDPNIKTYTSAKLGVTFRYQEKNETVPDKVLVKEAGNKIYVYTDSSWQKDETKKMEAGQFVEVFPKSAQDSLDEAIKKSILQGYNPGDCFVVDGSKNITNAIGKSHFIAREISYPKSNDPNDPLSIGNFNKCPGAYSQTNGMRFFLADTQHQTKYLFFSIGQYAISADGGLTWQDTIRFLE